MAKYNVELLRPGMASGVSGKDLKYTEEVLRGSIHTLVGSSVARSSQETNSSGVIGTVLNAKYQDGLECTVEIDDEDAIRLIDEGMLHLAPAIVYEGDEESEVVELTDISFRNMFLTGQPTELAGSTERKE